MVDQTEPDDIAPVPTVRSRAMSAGIDEDRLRGHLERGVLLLDGEPVTDLDTPAPVGTRINIGGQ